MYVSGYVSAFGTQIEREGPGGTEVGRERE